MNKTDITAAPVFEGEKTSRQAFLDLIIYELKKIDISTNSWYHIKMNNKQKETLKCVQRIPISSDINWVDIESLLRALGADITE